jgi:hypothetical protein
LVNTRAVDDLPRSKDRNKGRQVCDIYVPWVRRPSLSPEAAVSPLP